MNAYEVERTEAFKRKIGYQRLVERTENSSVGVAAEWPDLLSAPMLRSGGWTVATDSIWSVADGASRSVVLRSAQRTINSTMFVSTKGVAAALKELISRASATMTPEVPYEKGPDDLGDIAVSLGSGGDQDLIWVFHNVCFQMRGVQSEIDILAIARWLQSVANAHVVSSLLNHLPPKPALSLSSRTLQVGQTADLIITFPPDSEVQRYLVEVVSTVEPVSLLSQEPLHAVLRAETPGIGIVEVAIIDRRTLLSDRLQLTLDAVTPTTRATP